MSKEGKAGFNDVKVPPFGVTIVFRCMRGGGEMRDTIGGKKIRKGNVLTTIVRVECFDGGMEVFFYNGFESYEDFFDIRFVFEWVKPDIFSEMINEDYIVFKAMM